MQNNIPAVGESFRVSFKDGSIEFDAVLIYRDDDEREKDREFRLMIYNKTNHYRVNDKKFSNHESGIFISCVEKNWFNTELTGRLITPIKNPDFILVRLSDLVGKEVKGATAEITNPCYIHSSIDLKWRELQTIRAYKENNKNWLEAIFKKFPEDSCDFTGSAVNGCQFIIKRSVYESLNAVPRNK
jgi:hypothetical protein